MSNKDENMENIEQTAENAAGSETAGAGSAAAEETGEKPEKAKKRNPFGRVKRIIGEAKRLPHNRQILRRGGYSIVITALLIAALIGLNWLVSALAQRFHLDFDLTPQKQNSISEENIEYIENIKRPVTVTVCATEDDYADYISYYAQNLYNASGSADYFNQTINLVNRYAEYNKNITVRFIDTQSTEFTEIASEYSSEEIRYGDIIVSAERETEDGTVERHKVIGFEDIYTLADESGYAAMGYGSYTVSGNNIETALTGGIVYVLNAETKTVCFITGHSSGVDTDVYTKLLEDNNYSVSTVSDRILTALPEDCDVAIIMAPSVDFTEAELNTLSAFLDNGGKLGRGLMFYGDSAAPALPNLYGFLSQWGINAQSGILFETDENNHNEGDPSTMLMYPADDDEIAGENDYCITGYNIPLTAGEPVESGVEVTALVQTSQTVVKAPVGAAADWKGYTDADLGQFPAVMQAVKSDFDEDNNPLASYVMAFSSIEYINSDWADYSGIANKNVVLACSDRAAGVEDAGISFVSKTITNESYADRVTAGGVMTVRTVFMIVIPIAVIAAGIIIFVRRRRAQ